MADVLSKIGDGLSNSFLMAWEVWWALVLGFAISAVVQAWMPRARVQRAFGRSGARPVALGTVLGAASSSCSYAATAIAKSLFQKGASAASSLAFQFASTNLVVELGIVLWVLIGWQFTLAEFVGGLVLIIVMTVLLRLFISPRLEAQVREHTRQTPVKHQHEAVSTDLPLRARLNSADAWSDVAHNFHNDWAMLWKEITIGFLLAGFIGLLGNDFFNGLFIHNANHAVRTVENVTVGPIVAVLSFVCSMGNVPVAAVLWSGGISFGGVIAFLFADLIVLPIVAAYRKYYGTRYALRITALMFVTIVISALLVDLLFGGLGLIPHTRPTRGDIFGSVKVDYKLFTNVVGLIVFVTLMGLTVRRGATDPVCGMKVDRRRALSLQYVGHTHFFCSEHCLHTYELDAHDGARSVAHAHEAQHVH